MQVKVEDLQKELMKLRAEVKEVHSLIRGIFADKEGVIRKRVLRELLKASTTPKSKYIPHREVEKLHSKGSV